MIHSFLYPGVSGEAGRGARAVQQFWFEATRTGEYHLFCAEYCGTNHSGMIGQVVVMEPAQYEAWLGGQRSEIDRAMTPAAAGAQLLQQLGCAAATAAEATGPARRWKAIFGHR